VYALVKSCDVSARISGKTVNMQSSNINCKRKQNSLAAMKDLTYGKFHFEIAMRYK
jgi:hypothetical protein